MLYGPGRERRLEELVILLHASNWQVEKISRPGTSSLTQIICKPIIRDEDEEEDTGAWKKAEQQPRKTSPVKIRSVLGRLDSSVRAQERALAKGEDEIQLENNNIEVPVITFSSDEPPGKQELDSSPLLDTQIPVQAVEHPPISTPLLDSKTIS